MNDDDLSSRASSSASSRSPAGTTTMSRAAGDDASSRRSSSRRDDHEAKYGSRASKKVLVGNDSSSQEKITTRADKDRRSKRDDHAAKYGKGGLASTTNKSSSSSDDNFAMNEKSSPLASLAVASSKGHNDFDRDEMNDSKKLAHDVPSYDATANLQPGAERVTGTRISRAMESMGDDDDDSSLPNVTEKHDIENTMRAAEACTEPRLLEAELVEQPPSYAYIGGKTIDAVVVSMGDDHSGEDYEKLQKKLRKIKRRVIFFSLLLAVLIIIGVVVGVVLGTSGGGSNSNNKSAPSNGNVTPLADESAAAVPPTSPTAAPTIVTAPITPEPATVAVTSAPVDTGPVPSPAPVVVANGGGTVATACALSILATCSSSNSFACSALPLSGGTAELTFSYAVSVDGTDAIRLAELTSAVGDDVIDLSSRVLGTSVASGGTELVTHTYTIDLFTKGGVAVVVEAQGSTDAGSSCWAQRTINLNVG